MAPSVARLLSRLSRDRLINLCLEWLQSPESKPYLACNRSLFESDEEDYLHEPASSLQELRQYYSSLKTDRIKSDQLSKKDIVNRIIDGDWRRGLTLSQLASIDLAFIEQNDNALRWTALKLVPLSRANSSEGHPEKRSKLSHAQSQTTQFPHVTPAMFLNNLKGHISPLLKTYCSLKTLESRPHLTILRMQLLTGVALTPSGSSIIGHASQSVDTSRVLYIALSSGTPYIYVSVSTTSESGTAGHPKQPLRAGADIVSAKRFILEAVPKAFSRPQERWMLEGTKMTTRSLHAMCLMRGMEQRGTTGGVYSHFTGRHEELPVNRCKEDDDTSSDAKRTSHVRPTYVQLPTPPPEDVPSLATEVHRRFGSFSGTMHAPLSRFIVKISIVCEVNQPESSPMERLGKIASNKRKRSSLEGTAKISSQKAAQDAISSITDRASELETATLSLSLSGSDVFAGFKQLALLGPEYLDMAKIPSWATGENGVSTLTV